MRMGTKQLKQMKGPAISYPYPKSMKGGYVITKIVEDSSFGKIIITSAGTK